MKKYVILILAVLTFLILHEGAHIVAVSYTHLDVYKRQEHHRELHQLDNPIAALLRFDEADQHVPEADEDRRPQNNDADEHRPAARHFNFIDEMAHNQDQHGLNHSQKEAHGNLAGNQEASGQRGHVKLPQHLAFAKSHNLHRSKESELHQGLSLIHIYIESPDLTRKDRLIYAKEQMFSTFKKVFPYILLGVGIGALIHNWVPEEWVASVLGRNNPFGVILSLIHI